MWVRLLQILEILFNPPLLCVVHVFASTLKLALAETTIRLAEEWAGRGEGEEGSDDVV
jgi:hypothetical protein